MFTSNNRQLFHLWCKKNFVKHEKVSEYYENDCNFEGDMCTQARPLIEVREVSLAIQHSVKNFGRFCIFVSDAISKNQNVESTESFTRIYLTVPVMFTD